MTNDIFAILTTEPNARARLDVRAGTGGPEAATAARRLTADRRAWAKQDGVPSGLIKPLRVHLDANCVQNYHSDCAGRPI
jgi:hypothetical protein